MLGDAPRLEVAGVDRIHLAAAKPAKQGHTRKFKAAGRFRDSAKFDEGFKGHGGIVTGVPVFCK